MSNNVWEQLNVPRKIEEVAQFLYGQRDLIGFNHAPSSEGMYFQIGSATIKASVRYANTSSIYVVEYCKSALKKLNEFDDLFLMRYIKIALQEGNATPLSGEQIDLMSVALYTSWLDNALKENRDFLDGENTS